MDTVHPVGLCCFFRFPFRTSHEKIFSLIAGPQRTLASLFFSLFKNVMSGYDFRDRQNQDQTSGRHKEQKDEGGGNKSDLNQPCNTHQHRTFDSMEEVWQSSNQRSIIFGIAAASWSTFNMSPRAMIFRHHLREIHHRISQPANTSG